MKEVNLKVKGMTCSSCEIIIERSLKQVAGVKEVKVNRAKEQVSIKSSKEVSLENLQDALREKGYNLLPVDISSNSQKKSHSKDYIVIKNGKRYAEVGAVLIFMIVGYVLLKQFSLLPEGIGIKENMSYGFIFIIGLIAATSTCLAVSGGLILAITTKYNKQHPNLNKWQKFKPHIYFNIGRIISYTILGGLIGLLGSYLTLSPKVNGIIIIFASVIMIIMGMQLLNIFPWINKLQIKMPKFIAHKLYDSSSKDKEYKKSTASLFGAATFFLPCGFTQALQLYVLSMGSIVVGALTMLAFSLGTLPALISLGAFTSFSKGKFQKYLVIFSAILIIVLGLFNIPNGMALTGASVALPSFGSNNNNAVQFDSNVQIVDGKQIADMQVKNLDFYPHKFKLLQGVPVEWRIEASEAVGCAQVLTIPKLGITKYLSPSEENIITFVPKDLGIIPFGCTMGMTTRGAAFEVVPNTKGIKATELANKKELEYNGEVQKLKMEVSREKGFYPNSFTIKKDIPVELEIDTKLVISGCMSTMVLPDYNVAHLLSMGKTTLKFTPTKTGVTPFTCSMGSRQGEFIVVE